MLRGNSKNALHPPSLIKTALEEYISSHSLVHPSERRFILLDDELGLAVGVKRPDPGQTMPRDEVMRKLRAGVAWSVSVGGVVKYVISPYREFGKAWLIFPKEKAHFC